MLALDGVALLRSVTITFFLVACRSAPQGPTSPGPLNVDLPGRQLIGCQDPALRPYLGQQPLVHVDSRLSCQMGDCGVPSTEFAVYSDGTLIRARCCDG
jgi:hypothetical protein